MKNKFVAAMFGALLILGAWQAEAADKKSSGGLLGNTYNSQFQQITDTSIRITSRKKVAGTLDEINTPGTSTYKAFSAINDASVVRAAVEARNLGFKALKVSGTRNVSQTTERRSASSCPGGVCENSFTFAKGNYSTDVELGIEVTFDLLKDVPADATGYIDVEKVLKQVGL